MKAVEPRAPVAEGSGALTRLVRACAEHPKRTIAVWIAIVALVVVSSRAFGGELTNEMTIPGSDAQAAVDLLEERFPERAGDSAQLVFTSDAGLTGARAQEDIATATAAAREVPGVIAVGDAFAGHAGALSRDGTIGFVEVQFDTPASQVEESQVEQLQDDVRAAVGDSAVQFEFGGAVMDAVQPESKRSEVIGLAAAILVLLVVFGTVVAMVIPIWLALVSVGLGMSLLTLGAAFTAFHKVTPILAVMIGLGVAIDYALFIVMRFRQALADGKSPVDAAVTAGSTAGRAVIFAGLTVAISISGLALVGIPFVRNMGFGTAISVIVAVCAAVTLLPAALAKVGHRIHRGRVPFLERDESAEAQENGRVARLAGLVTRHPKLAVLATLAVLGVMAIPVLSIQLGTADAGTAPADATKRKAYDLLADGFGPGFNGPLLVAVDQQADSGAADRLADTFRSTAGVAAVVDPILNASGDTAQIPVYPTTSPQSPETADLVHTLRDDVVPAALAGSEAQAHVGGVTASNEDVATKMSERFPLFLAFVIGVICLILTMAFRSIVVAVKAALTTILSALAAFGALVAVFEWGWLSNLIGIDQTGPTASFLPVIVLSILFGLSMDYEVFLASRIREEYVKRGNARRAVKDGVTGVGRVIVAAGLIMGVVFSAFMLTDDRTVKSFGLGLAVAILVDALLVRMVLVPAVMHLLGDRAWYIPRWLDRLLPNLTIEAPEEPTEEEEQELRLPRAA